MTENVSASASRQAADCPQCGNNPVNVLVEASRRSAVWWFACPACGHMWQVAKNEPPDPAV